MSDDATTTTTEVDATKGGQSGTYTPPATQAELDRILADRLSRERGKYADYDDLKAKASKFDAAEEAAKSELQKVADRAAAAEARVKAFETKEQIAAWAVEITKDSTVPAAALRGSSREELEAHFETLKPLIAAPDGKRAAIGPYVPTGGTSAEMAASRGQQFADFLSNQ